MKTISELVTSIKRYNELYRAGNPEISDWEYDELVQTLRSLDPDNDWFKQIEPALVEDSRKRKLPIPMRSLCKVKNVTEVQSWLRSYGIPPTAKLVITPKFDGVSWLHNESTHETYSRGGDENEGQDCTLHYRRILVESADVFYWLSTETTPRPKYTFGELVFSRKLWAQFFNNRVSDSTGELYRSPRNTVAGLINRDTPPDLLKYTTYFRYGVDEESLEGWTSYSELYNELSSRSGLENLSCTITADKISRELLEMLYRKWINEYYIDGLVIYIDQISLWSVIGRQQTTGNPMYAMAYKDPNFTQTFETEVMGVDWNISKSGAMKPVVKINPVDVGDCLIEQPSGYNARWIKTNGIGKGAKIIITRSGGVIPKILSVVSPTIAEIPEICPNCGGPLVMEDAELICHNHQCEGRQFAKIKFFFQTVNIVNVGPEIIRKIFNSGIKTIKGFLNIKFDDILNIEGLGISHAENITKEMERIQDITNIHLLIHASSCFVDTGVARATDLLNDLSPEELHAFCKGEWKGYSDKNKRTVYQKRLEDGYPAFIEFIEENGFNIEEPKKLGRAPQGPLSDSYICFSGVRSVSLENLIKSKGGHLVANVTAKTTHLIIKSHDADSAKLRRARANRIHIMTIDEFCEATGIQL